MGKQTELPLIELRDVEIDSYPIPQGMKKVFASYNVLSLENGQMGFGNTFALFNPILYGQDNMEKFVADLQKSISMAMESKTGLKFKVQVLFFR